MTENHTTVDELIYDALVKEAGFLRDETVQCIQHVRNLAVQSTYIAGFALPVVAGLVGVDASKDVGSLGISLTTDTTFLIVQFVCLGVSLTSLAFLRIYIGSFLQIFTFAKYFRQHLIPTVKRVVRHHDIELFHWENWLKSHRAKKAAFVGDADLAAEPILIGLYTLTYGIGFVIIGIWKQLFMLPSIALGLGIGLLTVMSFVKFLKILKEAAYD